MSGEQVISIIHTPEQDEPHFVYNEFRIATAQLHP